MKWRALILGGGGSTGEFQMGVLPVLATHYDHFDMYFGVGVGSLHASVLAQHNRLSDGVQILLNFWKGIRKTSDLFDTPLLGSEVATLSALASDKGWARDGAYGNKKLRRLIGENVSWDRLQGKNNWAIEITSLSDGRLYLVTNNQTLLDASNNEGHLLELSLDPGDDHFIGSHIIDFVTASGSVPLMLPPVDIFGHRFVEGGLRDFTPLQLAVKAFELEMQNGYTEAEFVVVDNYRQEVDFEGPELLDSGSEIVLRAIKIMTVEMAQNDIAQGRERLEELDGVSSDVIMVHPRVDFRLHPMNFDDHELRSALRDHGNSQAEMIFGARGKNVYDKLLDAHVKLKKDESDLEAAQAVVNLTAQQPEMARSAREAVGGKAEATPAFVLPLSEEVLYPRSLGELIREMKNAQVQGKRIKAVGSGYTFSNILETDGVKISLKYLKNIWHPDKDLLKDPDGGATLCEFEGGATIDDLNNWLWPQGKTLLNQPGFEKLNFLGTATTGGHGSGIRIGPIAAAIKSLHLLTFDKDGNLVQKRIEPSDGITDPATFKDQFPGLELVQDDTVFNAAIVSAGTLGVIYSLIIETQERFFLSEKRTMKLWREVKPRLQSILDDEEIHSIHIWFNPYKIDGEIHCVLTEYRKVPGPRKGSRPWGTSWNGVDEVSRVVHWAMELFPKAIPSLLHASLQQVVSDEEIVLPNPEALNFGTPNYVNVHATNCGIPAKYTADAADRLFELFQQRFGDELYVTAPIGFRFTSPGEAFLSPQYRQTTCMIELPLLEGTDGALDTVDFFHDTLYQEFEGKPHWGQINRLMNKDLLKQLFPEWKSFIKVYKEYNHGDFDSPFTQQVGFRELIDEL